MKLDVLIECEPTPYCTDKKTNRQTNKQTDSKILPTPTDIVGVGKYN